MERGYGGEARFERSLGVTGAGAAEMAWEKATEGQGRRVGLEMQKQHGRMLRRGSEVGGYGDFFLLQSRTSFFFWLGAAWVKSRAERPSVSGVNRQLHVQIGCKLGIRNRKDELTKQAKRNKLQMKPEGN